MDIFTKMNVIKNFTKEQVDATKVGIELAKRALYSSDKSLFSKYASFSNCGNMNYEQHSKYFNECLEDATYKLVGFSKEFSLENAFRTDSFRVAYFSVIESIIDNVNSRNEMEDILNFADIRNMAEGDSMNIEVKATNAYFFSKQARGISYGKLNKYFGKNVVLSPTTGQSTVGVSRKDIVGGRVDWGKEIARCVRGIRSAYLYDVAQLVYDSSNPIGNKIYVSGTYSETTFRTNLQKLVALNGSTVANTYIYGTPLALSYILPSVVTNLQVGLGSEYMDKGYIPTQFGAKAIELGQAYLPDQTTAFLSDKWVMAISSDISKPIALGMSGNSRFELMMPEANATNEQVYTIKTDWDVKLAGQGRILAYQVAS